MDNTKPLDSDNVSIGDDDIRATKLDIENAIKVEHDFPIQIGLPLARHKFPYGDSSLRPTGYDGRLYFNTAQKVIEQYQSGSWKQISSLIPAGSRMLFYQLSAPNGWTKIDDFSDKMLRLVNDGSGGSLGGTNWYLPNITLNSYTMAEHTHTVGSVITDWEIAPPFNNDDNYCNSGGSYTISWAGHHNHILDCPLQGGMNSLKIKTNSIHNHLLTHNGSWRPKMTSVIVAEKW